MAPRYRMWDSVTWNCCMQSDFLEGTECHGSHRMGRWQKVELIYFIHPSTETGTSSVKSKKNTGSKVHKTINPSYTSVDDKCLWINGNS